MITKTPLDLDAIEARAKQATGDPDDGRACARCRTTMGACDPDEEPTPLCHSCAHHVAAELGADARALVAEVRRLRAVMLPLCAAARAAVNGIEPMAASVDDLLYDLKRAAARTMAGIEPDAPEAT